jgi:hypothetical protein
MPGNARRLERAASSLQDIHFDGGLLLVKVQDVADFALSGAFGPATGTIFNPLYRTLPPAYIREHLKLFA